MRRGEATPAPTTRQDDRQERRDDRDDTQEDRQDRRDRRESDEGTEVYTISDEPDSSSWPYVDARTLVIDGCFYRERKYHPAMPDMPISADSYQECQKKCQENAYCEVFGFWDGPKECWLGDANAAFENEGSSGSVGGPKECPAVPSGCTELPSASFPGPNHDTAALSFPSNRVPEKLECWPYDGTGGWYNQCPQATIIEDSMHGWPGYCTDVHQVTLPEGETCESQCKKNELCSVFQLREDGSCWQAVGSPGVFCFENPIGVYAGRVMHGKVRVLKSLVGVEIAGLTFAFDQNYFIDHLTNGPQACRFTCYSSLTCQYWVYSRTTGCFVEVPQLDNWPNGFVQYPPTTNAWLTGSEFATTIIAGEYIQHLCPGMNRVPEDVQGAWAPGAASNDNIFASANWASQAPPAMAPTPAPVSRLFDTHSLSRAVDGADAAGSSSRSDFGRLASMTAGGVLAFGIVGFAVRRVRARATETEHASEEPTDEDRLLGHE